MPGYVVNTFPDGYQGKGASLSKVNYALSHRIL